MRKPLTKSGKGRGKGKEKDILSTSTFTSTCFYTSASLRKTAASSGEVGLM
jgi:hypothetical protein